GGTVPAGGATRCAVTDYRPAAGYRPAQPSVLNPQWHTSSSSTARSRADAASFGPLHFTGYAWVNFQVRTGLPVESTSVTAPLRRSILLPLPANPSPELLANHAN